MLLEDYFDFVAPNEIRLRGHRIGIETILVDYLELGLFAEDVAVRYPSLSLEEVYATLTFYWRNREQMDTYLRTVNKEMEAQRQEQELHPSPAIQRLRKLARQRDEQRARGTHA